MPDRVELGAADASDLIDPARYPIADLDAPGTRRVIAEGRAQLARDGLCLLPGFVAGSALEAMAAEARAPSAGLLQGGLGHRRQ